SFFGVVYAGLKVPPRRVGTDRMRGEPAVRAEHFIMQVCAKRIAGLADIPDDLPLFDMFALADNEVGHMAVQRAVAVLMVDHDIVAVAVVAPLGDNTVPEMDRCHGTGSRGNDRGAGRGRNVG